jgi:FkbM family methyltransferase
MEYQQVSFTDPYVSMVLSSPFTESFIWKVIREKGVYDPYLLNKVRDLGLIYDGSFFIDAGANIGNHTVYWAKCYPKAMGISVEANPKVFKVLEDNIELNRLTNVFPVRAALSDSNGQGVESLLDTHSPGNSSVRRNEHSTDRTVTADSIYGDVFSEDADRPCSFIKIDCEHHDWEVLQGCKDIISRFKPAIAIEVWPEDLCASRDVRYLKPLIEEFLFDRGYSLHGVSGVNHIYTYGAGV